MDKKKAEEAMTKLKIAIRIKKEEIKNNKILFPRHDNSRLEEDIETYETAIAALEKEIIRSHMDDHGGKANEMAGWIPVEERLPDDLTNPITRDAYVYPVTVDLGDVTAVSYTHLDSGEYSELASYLIKETEETFREEDSPFKQRYSCSRNLITPEPKAVSYTHLNAKVWNAEFLYQYSA